MSFAHLNVIIWPNVYLEASFLMPVRSVLIVDDNAFIRQALCEFFVREGDFDVCGEAENGKEAIQKAQILSPLSS
jgi:CheY-like chemotaxis protein